MLEKKWFIIHQEKKFGPFTEQKILEMLKNGSLLRSQLIWAKGLETPITSYKLFLNCMNYNDGDQAKKTEKVEDELPPPLPVKVQKPVEIHKEIVDFKRLSGQKEELPPLPPDIIRKKTKKQYWKKLSQKALMLTALISLFLILYIVLHDFYLVYFKGRFQRIDAVDVKDSKILQKAAEQPREKLAIALMSSKDTGSLIFSSNFSYDGNIKLHLHSIVGKTLGHEEIEVVARGALDGGQAHLSQLKFLKGKKIYPGYYRVMVKTTDEKRSFYWYDRMYSLPQKILMKNITLFLGHLPLNVFNKKLKRFLTKRQKQEQQFTGDLQQKWVTIESIVEQLQGELLDLITVKPKEWKKEAIAFEKRYTNTFGSFFTEFYLSNKRAITRLENSSIRQKQKFDNLYKTLAMVSTQAGKEMSSLIERTLAFKFSPSKTSRLSLKKQAESFTSKLLGIIKNSQKDLSKLSSME